MMFNVFFFYLFASALVGSAIGAISVKRLPQILLFIAGVLLNTAGLFFLLGAKFLATVLIIVYLPIIVFLFLFFLGKLPKNHSPQDPTVIQKSFYMMGALFLMTEMIWILIYQLKQKDITFIQGKIYLENIYQIGVILYQNYFLMLQMVELILLGAIVGVITIMKDPQKNTSSNLHQDEKYNSSLNFPITKGVWEQE